MPARAARSSEAQSPDMKSLLERQGYRELVSANLFASGVALAPTLEDKLMLAEHSREELHHLELVAEAYEELTGRDLMEVIRPKAAEVPVPAEWNEMVIAGFLFDRAVFVQVERYRAYAGHDVSALATRLVEREDEHQSALDAALIDLRKSPAWSGKTVQQHIEKWYAVAAEALDPIESFAEARDEPMPESADVTGEYAASVGPTIIACGLALPVGDKSEVKGGGSASGARSDQ